MTATSLLNPTTWAAQTFGAVQLGDARRTRRVVALAASLLRRPDASLPDQLRRPSALKGPSPTLLHFDAMYMDIHMLQVGPAAMLLPDQLRTKRIALGWAGRTLS